MKKRTLSTRRLAAALAVALLGALAAGGSAVERGTGFDGPLRVSIITFNDLHGNIDTPGGTVTMRDPDDASKTRNVAAGGVEYLATLVRQLRGRNPNHVVVAAGDLIGASPLVSSLLREEPTIDALNALGLEASAVGNHEFDRGPAELQRIQNGGCHPQDDCSRRAPFAGAKFAYLAANVVNLQDGKTLFPPYFIKRFEGIPVAFVGVVVRDTAKITSAPNVAGLRFLDEADAVNALVPELKRQGMETIVALIHEGGQTTSAYNDPRCETFRGEIVNIVKRLDPAVDVIVSGHSHRAYLCRVDGRLVTQAGSSGRFVTTIDLVIDRKSRDVLSADARNHVVDTTSLARDPVQSGILQAAKAATKHISDAVVAPLAMALTARANSAGESMLGDLLADSQAAAFASEAPGGAPIAFMNPGGIRAPLVPRNGVVTYGDLYAVVPFGNRLWGLELNGEQIARLLEQQWSPVRSEFNILQVSGSFSYAWDAARPAGKRIVPGSIRNGGVPIEPGRSYRVVVNNFLAEGGDGFTVFTESVHRREGPPLLDALAGYLRAHPNLSPPAPGRIRRIN